MSSNDRPSVPSSLVGAFEDHEMRVLIGMFRTTAPAILATGKVAGGQLLKAAAADVEALTLLSLEKIDMRTKVKGQIRSDHQRDGIYKPRKARKNHKSTANLLAVPCYRDLLDDQDDEDPSERGRALVSSREGRRTQTAKCIADTKAEEPEPDEEADSTPHIPARLPAWPKMTLRVLFGGAEKPQELEDDVPDDGAIEIDSEDEYHA
ncbi:hypothetical protein B0H10DRAFT_2226549 [Mycena sp. CBHHK59/15]|nr:hypothetical protein B0H10DRAFT_2226549 [Mycena sp. CBHHK59/15]